MTKKTVFAYIVIIGCVLLLIGSYMKYQDKLSSFESSSNPAATPNVQPSKNKDDSVKFDELEMKVDELKSLTANADQSIQNVFLNRLESEEKLDFLIAGSTSLEKGEPGYAERLKTALENSYGDFLNVTVEAFDGSSNSFIKKMEDEIDFNKGFDIVLFEPFTLNNNGVVTIEDEREHIKEFQERLIEESDDTVIVLHPPNPIHAATYYPTQVKALKSFAKSEGIPYINHWENWPDPDTEEINKYLDDDGAPNSEGAELWANTLIDYFIAN